MSEAVASAGNYTGSLNYSEAIQVLSSPESAEQALMLFQLESSLAVALTLLAFVPSVALFAAGGALEMYEDSRFWLLLLVEVFFSVVVLGSVPFLISM
ncbi:hypothetical protein [Halapricum desulfuricans]|uniref:hypothetical protein n=1 Tax=Halapricum desulfuricans TaxID=2841257 RepID=UPI001E4275AD|nr:hypothetical protein [Halapricum desulfuricans]